MPIERVVSAIKRIRCHVLIDEYKLHELIDKQLVNEGITFEREFPLGPGIELIFLAHGGIGIEAKKGKPNENQVFRQLERYAQFDSVNGLILVIERYMDLPESINGKQVVSIGLRKLWGIASK